MPIPMQEIEVHVTRRVNSVASPDEENEIIFKGCSKAPYIVEEWLTIEQKNGYKYTKIPMYEVVTYSWEFKSEVAE